MSHSYRPWLTPPRVKNFSVGYCLGEYMPFDVRFVSSPMDLDHGMAIQSSHPLPDAFSPRLDPYKYSRHIILCSLLSQVVLLKIIQCNLAVHGISSRPIPTLASNLSFLDQVQVRGGPTMSLAIGQGFSGTRGHLLATFERIGPIDLMVHELFQQNRLHVFISIHRALREA